MGSAGTAGIGPGEDGPPPERVVVIGAGIAGLVLALCLARRGGFAIVLVERDPPPPPGLAPAEAFERWRRRGVAQFRHAHFFHPRFRTLLRERLPEVLAEILAAGARELVVREALPAALRARYRARPEDDRAVLLLARRALVEHVLRRHAAAEPAITILPATGAVGLRLDTTAQPATVRGVEVESGGRRTVLETAVLVDASGRSSRVPLWLRDAGIVPATEQRTPIDVLYVTRHYALDDPAPIDPRPVSGRHGAVGYTVCPGDNATVAVILTCRTGRADLRARLGDGDGFQAIAATIPAVAAWVDPARAQPLGQPLAMTGFEHVWRSWTRRGIPQVAGLFAVGDAAAGSNPAYGSGCSWAALHAALLADTLAATRDPVARAARFDARLRADVLPFLDSMRRRDRDTGRLDPAARGIRIGGSLRCWARALVRLAREEDPAIARRLLEQRYLMRRIDRPGEILALLAGLLRFTPGFLVRHGPRRTWRQLAALAAEEAGIA
jgi:2-polyprenyl-6-methoxyphenol hydroxylase-like FAD-dependent oxidoreductase